MIRISRNNSEISNNSRIPTFKIFKLPDLFDRSGGASAYPWKKEVKLASVSNDTIGLGHRNLFGFLGFELMC